VRLQGAEVSGRCGVSGAAEAVFLAAYVTVPVAVGVVAALVILAAASVVEAFIDTVIVIYGAVQRARRGG